MRAIALGIVLFGLPVMTSGDPLAPMISPRRGTMAPPPVERAISEKAVYRPETRPASQHRDDEDGAVILELRIGGERDTPRPRRLHCRGHAFPATVSLPPPAE